MKRILSIAAIAATVAGCSSISGYDAKSDFACKAPDGVLCSSMSGVYANGKANNLPGQRVNQRGIEASGSAASAPTEAGVLTRPIFSGTPIRTAPLVLRVWFSPWEDSDGDLHDQSFVYLPVDSGKWLIEHNRRRIQDAYRPVRAPAQAQAATAAGTKANVPSAAPVDGSPQSAKDYLNGLLQPGRPPAERAESESQ